MQAVKHFQQLPSGLTGLTFSSGQHHTHKLVKFMGYVLIAASQYVVYCGHPAHGLFFGACFAQADGHHDMRVDITGCLLRLFYKLALP